MKNPHIIDHYSRYRNQNPDIHRQIMILINNEIHAEQVITFLHNKYDSKIYLNDIHHLFQII